MHDHRLTLAVRRQIIESVRRANVSDDIGTLMMQPLSKPGRVFAEGGAPFLVALTLLSYGAAAQRDPIDVIPAAAAIELLTAAADLIDDVQDQEGVDLGDRRAAGSVLEAVSLLLILCHSSIASLGKTGIPAPRVARALHALDECGVAAIRGQDLDMQLELAAEVSMQVALESTQLKAASLTRCATEIGAILGADKDEEDMITLLAQFGWQFGTMAQLMNDVAAVWPGNGRKSDLLLRKKTIPIVFSLSDKALCRDCREQVRRYYYLKDRCGISEETVKKAIWHSGGIHYAWLLGAVAKTRAARISDEIHGLRPGPWTLGSIIS